MIPASGHSQRSDRVMARPRPGAGGGSDALGELFPSVPEAPARARGARVLGAVVQVAAVGIASVAMLLRVPGRPAWRTIFGDDYFEFLVGAIQHPWHWSAYGGDIQVLPRFFAHGVSYLPLSDASRAVALARAVVAAGCAPVLFHPGAGPTSSVRLRAPPAPRPSGFPRQCEAPCRSLAFCGLVVLAPSLGGHWAWGLRPSAGASGAAAIAAVVLAVSFGLILVPQPGARLFVVTAVAVGFIFTVISVGINRGPALNPMLPTQVLGTRYTIMADFLIVSALIVGADHALRSRAHDRRRQGAGLKSVTAVTAPVVFLAGTSAVDVRD